MRIGLTKKENLSFFAPFFLDMKVKKIGDQQQIHSHFFLQFLFPFGQIGLSDVGSSRINIVGEKVRVHAFVDCAVACTQDLLLQVRRTNEQFLLIQGHKKKVVLD